MFKIISILLFFILIASWVWLVFWWFINFEKKISFLESSSNNIISWANWLDTVILIFQSTIDITDAEVKSTCETSTQFLGNTQDVYIYKMKLISICENPYFHLEFWWEIYESSEFKLHIENREKIFSLLIDYNNKTLESLRSKLVRKINNYSKDKEQMGLIWENYFEKIKRERTYNELLYKEKITTNIINRRTYKYSVPVKWYEIAKWLNVIPNAKRDYRSWYTDWIHHWWDIMAPLWTPVSAIDDGIIIRVVDNFSYEDISNIKKWKNINHSQKLRNLDILRWNQVWLKTTKWDVIFYSHLDTIPESIKEWIIVPVGTTLWTIWVTGVPDKDYKNYHLHFPIQKNPYIHDKAWTYSMEDYMNWDWYLKWLNPTEVIAWQDDVFVKEVEHNHEEK